MSDLVTWLIFPQLGARSLCKIGQDTVVDGIPHQPDSWSQQQSQPAQGETQPWAEEPCSAGSSSGLSDVPSIEGHGAVGFRGGL